MSIETKNRKKQANFKKKKLKLKTWKWQLNGVKIPHWKSHGFIPCSPISLEIEYSSIKVNISIAIVTYHIFFYGKEHVTTNI